ncbi:MAG: alpha/beta hydrolase [Phycisphaerales bacterium]|nr:alpha/beta hydrolase [Phycisphaerales bacterium]
MIERSIQSGDARIWTASEGQGPPLLLCNGGPGCCDYLGQVSAMLSDRFRVIRFEERGCGRSSFTPPYDFGQTVIDVEAVRNAYAVDRWIIVGHSAGVDLALLYALTHPQHCRAIIGLAGGRVVNDRSWSEAYRHNRETIGEPLPEQPHPCDPRVNTESDAWWRQCITRPSLLADLARLETPAHFVLAERDIRPAWPTLQLAELLPRGSSETIPGARHMIWLDQPELLRRALRSFLDSMQANE